MSNENVPESNNNNAVELDEDLKALMGDPNTDNFQLEIEKLKLEKKLTRER